MSEFEDHLRERLAGRSREITPESDLDDLGVRVGAARRQRQRIVGATVGGLCVVLVAGLVAVSLQGEPDTLEVGTPEGSVSSSTTTATSTVPTSTSFTGQEGPEGPRGTTPITVRDERGMREAIARLVTTLYDVDSSDEQRLATIQDESLLAETMAALRAHEQYSALSRLFVTPGEITISEDGTESKITVAFEFDGRTGSVTFDVSIIAGDPRITRASFCSSIQYVTDFIGGPVLTCAPAGTATSTSSTSTTSTTSTTATTTTVP